MPRAYLFFASLTFFVAGLISAQPVAPDPSTAVVEVRIVNDATGQDVGSGTIRTFARATGDVPSGNFAARFQHGVASGIPYDLYSLCAYATGFKTECTDVPVYQPRVWVVVGLRFGGWQLTNDVVGTITGMSAEGSPTWVRLIGLYSGFSVETKASTSGHFELRAFPGKYVLAVIRSDRVLDTQALEVPTHPIEVVVAPK